jgi:hypothetical protein
VDHLRAKKILFDSYWTASGWRQAPVTAPADFAIARAAGYMFDPARCEHGLTISRAIALRESVRVEAVVDAFVGSLSSRRLAQRSALGSLAVIRNLPQHEYVEAKWCCRLCGAVPGPETLDLNVFNFERYKWGGVRHGTPEYAVFDLEQFSRSTCPQSTDADRSILQEILRAAENAAPGARPNDLQKAIAPLFPSNRDERKIILAILGNCGVLQPRGRTGFFREFTAAGSERNPPPSNKNDWNYPVAWWRGSDGVDREAVHHYFGL